MSTHTDFTTHCTHKGHDPPATPPHTSLLMQQQVTEHLPHAHLTTHVGVSISLWCQGDNVATHITKNTLQQRRGRGQWDTKMSYRKERWYSLIQNELHSCTMPHLGHHKMVMVSQVTAAPSEKVNKGLLTQLYTTDMS